MLDFIKKLFGSESDSSQKPQKPQLSKGQKPVVDVNSALSQGGPKIMINMHMFVKYMYNNVDPTWEGLFHFSGKDDHADVDCIRGFNDPKTAEVMPQLWQRKSFIENCKMFGCTHINFKDLRTGEVRVLKVAEIDENTLP
jgi:hypothetical protein